MNNQYCFSVKTIPDSVRQKFKFKQKQWRELGQNANSALMCSILEFLLDKNIQLLDQVVSQMKPSTQPTISFHNQLKTLIKEQGSTEQFFYNLQQVDSKNYSAGQFLNSYLNQKGMQYSTQDHLFIKASTEFKIQIQIYTQYGPPKKHGIDERNQIVLYYSGPYWYHLLNEEQKLGSLVKQDKECSYCHKQTSHSYRPACQHSICIDCLKKWFQSPQVSQIKCPFTKCPTMIERNRFLEFRDQLEKQQKQFYEQTNKQNDEIICCNCKQQIQIQEMFQNETCSHLTCRKCLNQYNDNYYFKSPQLIKCLQCKTPINLRAIKMFFNIPDEELTKQQENIQNHLEKCQKCQDQQTKEDLFENPICKHKFCRSCLNNYINKYSPSICFNTYCPCDISSEAAKKFLSEKSSSPQKLTRDRQYETLSNIVGCSKCHRHRKSVEYYNNYCGHSYCQSCADQEIVKGQTYFLCHSPSCFEKIIVEDVQQYFYNQLLEKNKRQCNLCLETYIPSSMFKNHKCDHYLCYNCVNKIAQKQQFHITCPVIKCFAYINADELDTYFTDKQEEILKEQLKLEEEDLKIKQEEQLKQQQQQQQHPSLSQSEIQNESNPTEDEMVRIAIESSLKNSNQQKQESKIERSVGISDNKLSQIIKAQAQEAQKKLIEDPPQDDQATENMEIEANNESKITQILKQNIEDIEGNCTFCRFPFSDFNLPQQLDCKKHRIGVCCLRYGIQCSQCNYQEIKQKEQSKTKKKFKIFQEESYYPQSPQLVSREAEDAKPNSRLSSRIYAQPLQQRSHLYQSQGLYPSTQAMRNASVGYNINSIGRRF